jgi:hypothetical protein
MIMTSNVSSVRRGFALPVVILAMFILVGALASGFAMLSGERIADDATLQQQNAAALAETGLQQGLSNRAGLGLGALPGATPDSVRITLAGGYADVITTRLRAPVADVTPGIYVVRSRGVRQTSRVADGGDAVATATSFATYNVITMTVQSAMTGINGIQKQGTAGQINGADQCGEKAALPAVAVPGVPGVTGSGQWQNSLLGDPKADTIGSTRQEAADAVPIDWNGIVNENAITADYDLPSDGSGFPTEQWFNDNPNSWPTIIVRNGPFGTHNAFALPVPNGRGLLIVFGNLRFTGGGSGWNGLILVGGRLVSNGGQDINGAMITGLNEKLGQSVEENDVEVNTLNGTKNYNYNSCHVRNALNGGGGSLRAYQGTWANSFPTY